MSSSSVQLPSFIYLYNGARTENLNLEEIGGYLESWFKQVKIELREDFFSYYFSHLSPEKKETAVDEIAKKLLPLQCPLAGRSHPGSTYQQK